MADKFKAIYVLAAATLRLRWMLKKQLLESFSIFLKGLTLSIIISFLINSITMLFEGPPLNGLLAI